MSYSGSMSDSGSKDNSIASKLAKLPAVHIPKSQTRSVYFQQSRQLQNDDPRRLKDPVQKRGSNKHIPSHVYIHCEDLFYLPWKGTYFHSKKAASHLKECDEGGRD